MNEFGLDDKERKYLKIKKMLEENISLHAEGNKKVIHADQLWMNKK